MTDEARPDDEDDDDGEGVAAGDIASGPGAAAAATRWTFPSAAHGRDEELRFVVFNPDPDRSIGVALLAVANGRETPVEGARDAVIAPGGRSTFVDDSAGSGWIVEASAAVVVERVLVRDGIRSATGIGIPSADGSMPLTLLAG